MRRKLELMRKWIEFCQESYSSICRCVIKPASRRVIGVQNQLSWQLTGERKSFCISAVVATRARQILSDSANESDQSMPDALDRRKLALSI